SAVLREHGRTRAAELLRQLGDGSCLLGRRHAGLLHVVVPATLRARHEKAPAQAHRGSTLRIREGCGPCWSSCAGRPLVGTFGRRLRVLSHPGTPTTGGLGYVARLRHRGTLTQIVTGRWPRAGHPDRVLAWAASPTSQVCAWVT